MFQAPSNNIIVEVAHKYIGNISSILKVSAIQNGSTVDPADLVNITGKIVSLPKMITDDREHKGFSIKDIEVGDTAIFSYNVIYDMEETDQELPKYKNRVWYEGKELFSADITKVFGVIRNGEIIMINGYVMTTIVEPSKLVLPAHMKKIKNAAKAQVLYIGMPKEDAIPIDVYKDDWVFFNPFIAQIYQINGKPFSILKQSQILGKSVA